MAITTVTILDNLKTLLNQSNVKSFTDIKLEDCVNTKILYKQGSYTFYKKTDSVYKYETFGNQFIYSDTPFTEADECSYRINANGILVVTEGSDSRDSIIVTGTLIDFNEAAVSLIETLMVRCAGEGSNPVTGGAAPTREELCKVASQLRGIKAL